MNKTIRSGAREMIYKVFMRTLAEFQAGKLLTELEDAYKRTANLTGKSESTVRRIVRDGERTNGKFHTPAKHRKGRPKKDLDDFDLCAIRQKIQQFYVVKKEVPTLSKLLTVLKQDIGYTGGREYLRLVLQSIGFRYNKCQSNINALLEKDNIAAKREKYLRTIMQNRALPEELQKDIIYLDESYIHSSNKVQKWWQSKETVGVRTDIAKGKRWIIVHAASEKGFVPNALLLFSGANKQEDYHSEMNKHNFTKWVSEKLMPNIKDPSIIVMDNAPYHSVIKNKSPTSTSKVGDIKKWLIKNNIPFESTLRKPSLLVLARKHRPDPVYEIDEILGKHGHTVARLPPYHCDLNPIELIWAQVKAKVALRNVGTSNIKELTEEAFGCITSMDWKRCCEHVKNIEKEYYERGRTLYENIEQLVIQLGEESSTEESEIESEEMEAELFLSQGSVEQEYMSGVEYLDFDVLD